MMAAGSIVSLVDKKQQPSSQNFKSFTDRWILYLYRFTKSSLDMYIYKLGPQPAPQSFLGRNKIRKQVREGEDCFRSDRVGELWNWFRLRRAGDSEEVLEARRGKGERGGVIDPTVSKYVTQKMVVGFSEPVRN